MALRYLDSFDHYDDANEQRKWTDFGGFAPSIVAGAGSCGSAAMQITVFNIVTKGINFASATTTVGFRLLLDTALGVVAPISLLALGDGFADHLLLTRTSDGALHVYRRDGASSTLLGSSPADVLRDAIAYYLEVQSTIHNSTGAVELKVNGTVVLTITGADTASSATGGTIPTRVTFYGNGNQNYFIDDLYVLDAAGGGNTTYLGPIRVEGRQATAAGAHQDWALVGSKAQHYLAVNDGVAPDGDTSYITSATVGQIDVEEFEDTGLPAGGTVFGVQLCILARKTDSGYRGLSPVLRLSGTDAVGTEQNPSQDYRYLHQVWDQDPVGAAAWTIAKVNALQAGVKVTA